MQERSDSRQARAVYPITSIAAEASTVRSCPVAAETWAPAPDASTILTNSGAAVGPCEQSVTSVRGLTGTARGRMRRCGYVQLITGGGVAG